MILLAPREITMNLEMLSENKDGKEEKVEVKHTEVGSIVTQVSTGKKALLYDEKRADLEQPVPGHLANKPYIVRAFKYVEKQGFIVVKTLKEALLRRDSLEKVVTFREADIALRSKLELNHDMIWASLAKFGGFLCEESQFLTDGVFELRARWNKGLEWKKAKRSASNQEQQKRGDKMLEDIEKLLNHFNFPLHDEEREEGFDKEFMKPEYLNWEQFHAAVAAHRVMSIENKAQRKQVEREVLS